MSCPPLMKRALPPKYTRGSSVGCWCRQHSLFLSLRHISIWEFLLCNWKSIEDFLVVEVGKKEEEEISWVVWCPLKVQLNRLGVRPYGLGGWGTLEYTEIPASTQVSPGCPGQGGVCSRTWWGQLVRLWVLPELLWGLGDEMRHRFGKETTSLLLHEAQYCEGTQGWWFWEHPSEHLWHWLKHSFMHWRWGSCKRLYGQRRWTLRCGFERKGKLKLGGNHIDPFVNIW